MNLRYNVNSEYKWRNIGMSKISNAQDFLKNKIEGKVMDLKKS